VGAALCLRSSSTALADGTLTTVPPFAALLAMLATPGGGSDKAVEAALNVLCVYAMDSTNKVRTACQHMDGVRALKEFAARLRSCVAPLLLMAQVQATSRHGGVRRASVQLLGAAAKMHKAIAKSIETTEGDV